jgi:hypothetical protein
MATYPPPPPGWHYIFRPYKTLKDGTVVWAKDVGKKAFRFLVKD